MTTIAQTAQLDLGRPVQLVRFLADGQALGWPELAQALCDDPAFREVWNQAWAAAPYDCMWKPLPLHPSTLDHPFFAVLTPCRFPAADPTAYREHLAALKPGQAVASFPNLSGDAWLVVPADTGPYGHLRAFCTHAPAREVHAFWSAVGQRVLEAIASGRPCWCNTHGTAVPWFHVRFDRSLKYAAFPPYGAINETSQAIWLRDLYSEAWPRP